MRARTSRLIIAVTPPIVLNVLLAARRWMRGRDAGHIKPDWEMVANDHVGWGGWDHSSIAKAQVEKWDSFAASIVPPTPLGRPHEAAPSAAVTVNEHNKFMTFAYVLGRVAATRPGQPVRILDWGGGIGHYAALATQLYPEIVFDYVVKDLPALCEAGRIRQPNVAFVESDDTAFEDRYDLVFASSSLHYSRDVWSVLSRLCSVAEWMMITRTPFVTSSDDFVVVQRPHSFGYMTEYACWFLNERKLMEHMGAAEFQLQREFIVNENPLVPNAPEQGIYKGFLFRRVVHSIENFELHRARQ